jgi:hypothetical protein
MSSRVRHTACAAHHYTTVSVTGHLERGPGPLQLRTQGSGGRSSCQPADGKEAAFGTMLPWTGPRRLQPPSALRPAGEQRTISCQTVRYRSYWGHHQPRRSSQGSSWWADCISYRSYRSLPPGKKIQPSASSLKSPPGEEESGVLW